MSDFEERVEDLTGRVMRILTMRGAAKEAWEGARAELRACQRRLDCPASTLRAAKQRERFDRALYRAASEALIELLDEMARRGFSEVVAHLERLGGPM